MIAPVECDYLDIEDRMKSENRIELYVWFGQPRY